MQEEIWKDVPLYEWLYKVSSYWRVISRKWEIMKPQKNSAWYLRIILCINWTKKRAFVHRLVIENLLWLDYWKIVNHKDWNRLNNNILNLEYTTKSWNFWHADSIWLIRRFYWKDNPCSKKVSSYDLDMNLIKTYESVWEAHRITWINSSGISKVCNWIRWLAGWFIWKYT